MDLFEATCQGIGLALAAGMVAGGLVGSAGPRTADVSSLTGIVLVVFGIGAAYLFGDSLAAEDHPGWPGWIAGVLLAVGAFAVIRGVVSGAATRAGEGGSPAVIAALAVLAAIVLAALSLTPAAPISLAVLLALAYLAVRRRRRAGEKYEGLRILR
jgi:MYXO-CTERM domain-containing protein